MKWLMYPLLVLVANTTESELAKYVEYLKVENQVLRDRLPTKIDTAETEPAKISSVDKPPDSKTRGLITIVTPHTFQR